MKLITAEYFIVSNKICFLPVSYFLIPVITVDAIKNICAIINDGYKP